MGFSEDLVGGLGPGERLAAVVPAAGEPAAGGGDPVHPDHYDMPAHDASDNWSPHSGNGGVSCSL